MMLLMPFTVHTLDRKMFAKSNHYGRKECALLPRTPPPLQPQKTAPSNCYTHEKKKGRFFPYLKGRNPCADLFFTYPPLLHWSYISRCIRFSAFAYLPTFKQSSARYSSSTLVPYSRVSILSHLPPPHQQQDPSSVFAIPHSFRIICGEVFPRTYWLFHYDRRSSITTSFIL